MGAHSSVSRQSLIPELVRNGNMLKNSTPSELAKTAKCFAKFTKSEFLPNLHKFCEIPIFVFYQGQGHCRI